MTFIRDYKIGLILMALGLVLQLVGCASTNSYKQTSTTTSSDGTQVTTTETTEYPQTTQTTTTTVEETPKERGLLGATFYFIGQVIAFPFKVVGGIIDAIF